MLIYGRNWRMRTVRGWDVAGDVAMLPRPLTSGLNLNDREVPHAREFWVLSASLPLAEEQLGLVTQYSVWGLKVKPGITLDIHDHVIKCRYEGGVDEGCICMSWRRYYWAVKWRTYRWQAVKSVDILRDGGCKFELINSKFLHKVLLVVFISFAFNPNTMGQRTCDQRLSYIMRGSCSTKRLFFLCFLIFTFHQHSLTTACV